MTKPPTSTRTIRLTDDAWGWLGEESARTGLKVNGLAARAVDAMRADPLAKVEPPVVVAGGGTMEFSDADDPTAWSPPAEAWKFAAKPRAHAKPAVIGDALIMPAVTVQRVVAVAESAALHMPKAAYGSRLKGGKR